MRRTETAKSSLVPFEQRDRCAGKAAAPHATARPPARRGRRARASRASPPPPNGHKRPPAQIPQRATRTHGEGRRGTLAANRRSPSSRLLRLSLQDGGSAPPTSPQPPALRTTNNGRLPADGVAAPYSGRGRRAKLFCRRALPAPLLSLPVPRPLAPPRRRGRLGFPHINRSGASIVRGIPTGLRRESATGEAVK